LLFASTFALNVAWVFEKVQHGLISVGGLISLRLRQLHGHLKSLLRILSSKAAEKVLP
jgi:hypothetical protein